MYTTVHCQEGGSLYEDEKGSERSFCTLCTQLYTVRKGGLYIYKLNKQYMERSVSKLSEVIMYIFK